MRQPTAQRHFMATSYRQARGARHLVLFLRRQRQSSTLFQARQDGALNSLNKSRNIRCVTRSTPPGSPCAPRPLLRCRHPPIGQCGGSTLLDVDQARTGEVSLVFAVKPEAPTLRNILAMSIRPVADANGLWYAPLVRGVESRVPFGVSQIDIDLVPVLKLGDFKTIGRVTHLVLRRVLALNASGRRPSGWTAASVRASR